MMAKQVQNALNQNDLPKCSRIFVDYWSADGTYDALNPVRQQALNKVVKKIVLDFQAAAGAPLSLSDYQALSVPACLIAGKRSRAETQKITRLLAASITTSTYHEVDSGHMGPVSDPEAVNKLVYEFISRISPET